MPAGADSIDDTDLLRHGGMYAVFDGIRAPRLRARSVLRKFTHGHIQQLGAVGTRLLTGLAAHVLGLTGQYP